MTKNILIVEDQRIVQMGLQILISESLPHVKMDFASSFCAAQHLATNKSFDLIILDIHIPGSENSKMIGKFRQLQPGVKIIVFSGLQEKIYAPLFMQAGADSFVSKMNDEKSLIRNIKKVLSDHYLPAAKKRQPNVEPVLHPKLSSREYEVVALLMQGKITKEIASGMNLKATTISTYKSRIYGKLNVDNIIDLIRKVKLYKSLS